MPKRFDPEVFNRQFPITGVRYYKNGTMEIIRKNELPFHTKRGYRGRVTELSRNSRERLALTVVESPIEFVSMITLTYGPQFPDNGKTAKLHLYKFLRGMKRVFGRFDYVWFMEFTKRGRVHFHILTDIRAGYSPWERQCFANVWIESQGLEMWKYSRLKDKRIVVVAEEVEKVHKHPKAWEMIREKNGAAKYALKYSLKLEQKEVPYQFRDVGRFWGTSRPVKEAYSKLVDIEEKSLRDFLAIHSPRLSNYDILPKIIFGSLTIDERE